jgi:hypothetical protein
VIPYIGNEYADKLGFKWECLSFETNSMTMKLTFENPQYVSHMDTDLLLVTVKDSSFFEREAFQDYLPTSYSMEKVILSIMEETKATAILSSVTGGAKTTMDVAVVFNLATNIAFSTSMYLLWGLINTLQMILYLPLL